MTGLCSHLREEGIITRFVPGYFIPVHTLNFYLPTRLQTTVTLLPIPEFWPLPCKGPWVIPKLPAPTQSLPSLRRWPHLSVIQTSPWTKSSPPLSSASIASPFQGPTIHDVSTTSYHFFVMATPLLWFNTTGSYLDKGSSLPNWSLPHWALH